MGKKQEQQKLEEMLIVEEYDPVTLEERSEESNSQGSRMQATKMVKTAYSKVDNGYAIVREHLAPIAIICMCVFLAVPILFLTFFIINKWWQNGVMFFACIFFSCASILVAYLIVYRNFIKNTKKYNFYFEEGTVYICYGSYELNHGPDFDIFTVKGKYK